MITKVVPNVPVTKVEICWTIVNQDLDYFPAVVANTSSRPVGAGLVNGSDAGVGSRVVAAIAEGTVGLAVFTVWMAAITAAA